MRGCVCPSIRRNANFRRAVTRRRTTYFVYTNLLHCNSHKHVDRFCSMITQQQNLTSAGFCPVCRLRHGASKKLNRITLTFWTLFIHSFLFKIFFKGSCHFCEHMRPSLNEYVGFKKIFQVGKQQKRRKMDQKTEEKMSHGVRNGIFKAPLTLKKIRNISAKERVLTPSVWRYLTFFW